MFTIVTLGIVLGLLFGSEKYTANAQRKAGHGLLLSFRVLRYIQLWRDTFVGKNKFIASMYMKDSMDTFSVVEETK